MKRAAPVLLATAGGLALLASFKTSTGTAVNAGDAAATTAPSPATTTTSTSTTTHTTATTVPTTTRRTLPPTTVLVHRTIDGPNVPNQFGPVQVRVTFTGRHIDDVEAIQLPQDRRRSAELSTYAGPRLRQEALQAQSARIQVVSGASYTSESYIRSLQAAIDANG
ncbi:MAG TPA: FMN-binding protein [Acidimicrobiales bacterium]|nr:FMN-binding protein [Acidimicrobiales bacterium]